MIRTRGLAAVVVGVLTVAAVDACRHSAPPAAPPTPTATRDTAAERRAAEEARRRDSVARANAEAQRRADSIAAARRNAASAADAITNARNALTATVHFEFDKSDVRDDDRATIDMKVRVLQANPSVTLRIAGHTDERGSDQYNLALGQRRAAAVKQYLVAHGIADARLETISYGEERPAAQGHDEGAWAQNRRAEFEITAGGQMLRAP